MKITGDLEQMFFGMKRDKQSEVLVPFQIFQKLGLSQPCWFVISLEDESITRICLGLMNTQLDQQDNIYLSPKLQLVFKNCTNLHIKPLVKDSLILPQQRLIDFSEGCHIFASKVNFQLITIIQSDSHHSHEEDTQPTMLSFQESVQEFLNENPKLIQIGEIIEIELKFQILLLKVVEIQYQDPHKAFHSKVLDLTENQQTQLLTKLDNQIANDMMFNKYYGYLVHHSRLQEVKLMDKQAQISRTLLPPYLLRHKGKLNIFREFEAYNQTQEYLEKTLNGNNNSNLQLIHLFGQPGSGKTTNLQDFADKKGILYLQYDCLDYFNIIQLKKLISEVIYDKSKEISGLIVELVNFDQYKLLIDQFSQGSSKSKRDLTEMRFAQAFEESIETLTHKLKRGDRENLIQWLLTNDKKLKLSDEEFLRQIKMGEISKYMQGKTIKEIRNIMIKVMKTKHGQDITNEIITKRLNELEKQRKAFGEKSVRVPEVKWADIGGLANAKEDILQTIMLPIEKPHLFKNGVAQRSGLLFYGPPGTGKTLLAKAIATECQMNFISVKGPELLNMYVGESEKNVREVFERARENLPCIIFFDELDSLAPARGKGSDSSQVMDRIVAQLLTEIDGLGKKTGMFVIGATNRPDLLDSALLRTGRFDKMIYLGVAKTAEERVNIIKAQTRNLALEKGINLEEVVKNIPENFTGADFSALTTESYMIAVKEKIQIMEQEITQFKIDNNISQEDELLPETFLKLRYPNDEEEQKKQQIVLVKQAHMVQALSKITPSISLEELRKYEELRDKFSASNDQEKQ
eukprot:403353605